jgi:hypothetical protein
MSKSLFSNVNWKNPSLILSYKQQEKSSIELILIKNLLNSEFAINIQNVIKYYYIGNFNEVLALLTKEKLQYLSNLLNLYKKNPIQYPLYEKVRLLLKLYLEGLSKSITQFLELSNIKIALTKAEERCEILDNMKKLQVYIDNLNHTINLFDSAPVNVIEAKILPEHATYLRMYGYPVGGIFDSELLNAIKLELLDKADDTSLNILL